MTDRPRNGRREWAPDVPVYGAAPAPTADIPPVQPYPAPGLEEYTAGVVGNRRRHCRAGAPVMTDIHPTPSAPRSDEPLGDLLRTATGDLSTLFRQELELAKVEMKEDIRQVGQVGGMFGAGGVCGYFALLFVSFAVAWLLDDVMPRPLAFLIVAVPYAIATAVLLAQGRRRATGTEPRTRTDDRDSQGGRPMGQTPDQLRRDIEDTRDHLGDTLGAIEDRMSPRAIVDRRRSAMAERWRSMREAVMGRADDLTSSASETAHGMASNASDVMRQAPQMVAERAQGNPWAAGLIAFGAGLLAASLFPATRVEQEQAEPGRRRRPSRWPRRPSASPATWRRR